MPGDAGGGEDQSLTCLPYSLTPLLRLSMPITCVKIFEYRLSCVDHVRLRCHKP